MTGRPNVTRARQYQRAVFLGIPTYGHMALNSFLKYEQGRLVEMVVSKVLDFKILILFRGITTQDVKGRRTDGNFFFKKKFF